jgi:hypothetical protein
MGLSSVARRISCSVERMQLIHYWKPDYECAFRRKARILTVFDAEQSGLCSPVCRAEIAKYGHFSRMLRRLREEILRSPDCVAERKRFEPLVQV